MFRIVQGSVLPHFTNPRMGLSAHLEGLTAGMLLVLMGGCVWEYLNLSEKIKKVAYYLGLYASYGTWAGTFLAAILGTSRLTPIAGSGYGGSEGQETVVTLYLVSVSLSILIDFCFLLYGLRNIDVKK